MVRAVALCTGRGGMFLGVHNRRICNRPCIAAYNSCEERKYISHLQQDEGLHQHDKENGQVQVQELTTIPC